MIRKFVFPLLRDFGQWLVSVTAPIEGTETGPPVPSSDSAIPPVLEELPRMDGVEFRGLDQDRETAIAETIAKDPVSEVAPVCETVPVPEPVPVPELADVAFHIADDLSTPVTLDEPEAAKETNAIRDTEMVAVCKVLSVLEKQLQEVNTDVESSVMGVCHGFRGMAQRAQAAVNAAQDAMGGANPAGADRDLISAMRSVVGSLVNNIQTSCEFSQSVSGRLSVLESRLADVELSLKDVESIAKKAKFVALNGQIESSRLGDAGRAMAVVARETKDLATEAAQASDSILRVVNQLASELKSTSSELKVRTEADRKRFAESDRLARGLLDDIHVHHQNISTSLGLTGKISGELRNDIAQAVVSMQFQDRVSQKIAHVVGAMSFLIDQVLPNISANEDDGVAELWLNELGRNTTMDSERRLIDSNQQADAHAGQTSSETCSVELF